MSGRAETLIIVPTLAGDGCYLKDAYGQTIGHFSCAEKAEQWAEANGYRTR